MRDLFADLRESGDIEQEADVVALLHGTPEDKFVRELLLEKVRAGRTGLVRVAWRPELTRFEGLEDPPGGGAARAAE